MIVELLQESGFNTVRQVVPRSHTIFLVKRETNREILARNSFERSHHELCPP
jgi:hypothetical protein